MSSRTALMQVMVANVRCEEIMLERLGHLKEQEEWQLLASNAAKQLVAEFGMVATALLSSCLSGALPLAEIDWHTASGTGSWGTVCEQLFWSTECRTLAARLNSLDKIRRQRRGIDIQDCPANAQPINSGVL